MGDSLPNEGSMPAKVILVCGRTKQHDLVHSLCSEVSGGATLIGITPGGLPLDDLASKIIHGMSGPGRASIFLAESWTRAGWQEVVEQRWAALDPIALVRALGRSRPPGGIIRVAVLCDFIFPLSVFANGTWATPSCIIAREDEAAITRFISPE